MPNRIIKESACTSDTLALLSADAERLWWRLIVQADDYGLFDGRPSVILGKCLTAFVQRVSIAQVSQWLSELQQAGLIRMYEVGGKPYLKIVTWEKHQRPPRAKEPKYPLPPPQKGNGVYPLTPDSTCGHVTADAPVPLTCDSTCGHVTADAPVVGIRDRDSRSGFASRDAGGGVGEPSPRPPAVPAAHAPSGGGLDQQPEPETPDAAGLPPNATAMERAVLQELRSVPRYPFDYAEDLAFVRRLAVDYPSVDLLVEAKRWRDWLSAKPPQDRWNPRLRFRNWCEIAAKRSRDSPARRPQADPSRQHPLYKQLMGLHERAGEVKSGDGAGTG